MRTIPTPYERWLLENEDRLEELWNEKLNYMQDCMFHVAKLRESDKAFYEFCADVYERETGREA